MVAALVVATTACTGSGDTGVSNEQAAQTPVDAAEATSTTPLAQSTTSTTAPIPASDETYDGRSEARAAIEEDGSFRWLELSPGSVEVVWLNDLGMPLSQMEEARLRLEEAGHTVLAIANAGIYDESLRPLGLHVEDGVEMTPLNTKSGSGNFYLQPNGVFATTESGYVVLTTADFTQTYSRDPAPTLVFEGQGQVPIIDAVQSGPMLVVDGEINDLFTPASESVTTRTAVGVDGDANAILIQARRPVNMWTLANHARQLGLMNVLYLDGSVARFDPVAPGRRVFPNVPLAAMIAVTDPDSFESSEVVTDE